MTDVTTIRLPHTGLRVPDSSLTVTGYKGINTHDGVAFTAKLRINNRIVGVIENTGVGGPTSFYGTDPKTFGDRQLEDYAARCQDDQGGPISAEALLDEVITESDTARSIKAAARKNGTVLRLMDASFFGLIYQIDGWVSSSMPTSTAQWGELARQLVVKAGEPGDGQWWQGWDGKQWLDVTARPKNVDTNIRR